MGLAMLSSQLGVALATQLFDDVGSSGAVLLRVSLAVPLLMLFWPPRWIAISRARLLPLGLFGLAIAGMNLCFFASVDRIPLGIASTLEFIGPLSLAVLMARKPASIFWAALAGTGVILLARGAHGSADIFGLVLAVVAGAFWAAYIVMSARIGELIPGQSGVTVGIMVATVVAAPLGIASGGGHLLRLSSLAVGVGVAIMCTVVPHLAELEALRRIAPGTFGVLASLEPGVAAMVGLVALSQGLTLVEVAGIGCVVLASTGALRVSRIPPPTAT